MGNQWKGSTRRKTLPRDWPRIRRQVLERDGYRCTHLRADTETRCVEDATDVDHIGDRHDHTLPNLTAKCEYHHLEKTAAQANAVQAARPEGLTLTRRIAMEKRKPKRHPGLL